MSRRFPLLAVAVVLASVVWCAAPSSGQEQGTKTLTAAQAAEHVGKVATVCGEVASATYAARSRGRPTFLNLDEPYPDHIFTIVIWGENRGRFREAPELLYRDRRICVTGEIEIYRGTPQIEVEEPGQIVIHEDVRE